MEWTSPISLEDADFLAVFDRQLENPVARTMSDISQNIQAFIRSKPLPSTWSKKVCFNATIARKRSFVISDMIQEKT